MFARLFSLFMILIFVFAASRALIRLLPGDPIETLIAETGTPLPKEKLQSTLHLNQPFLKSLTQDFLLAIRGDFGSSIFTQQPIAPLLWERLLNTLQLTFFALLLGLAISLPLGLVAADSSVDGMLRYANPFCSLYGAITAALPTPWIGSIFILIFQMRGQIALPTLTLALGFSGFWSRLIRDRVRETLQLGSAPGARSRGIPEWKVALKYGLAPASGSLLAYLGTQIGSLMTGAFITEVIFDWPGMGSLFVDAVLRRDYPLIEATAFVTAACALMGNAIGDWAQSQINNA